MNKLTSAIFTEESKTLTENLMPVYSSSLDACVDMFFRAGACRKRSDNEIISIWEKAYAEDKNIAYKLLFWTRDIRGGAGERRFFRVILNHISQVHSNELTQLLRHVPEYGRWDDIFTYTSALDLLVNGIKEGDGLLAKWLPREGPLASKMRSALKISPKTYRKLLKSLSNTVEQKMCAKDWKSIEYNHVPSVAFKKYRKAFARNDETRFNIFLESVIKGKEKVHASAIFPHDIISDAFDFIQNWNPKHTEMPDNIKQAIRAQWMNLPNYLEGSNENIIAVCDVSGSMFTNVGTQTHLPIRVSVALGLYMSERLEGPFKDTFITFSATPRLQHLKGDVISRISQLIRSQWDMDTNLEAIFRLILDTAVNNKISASEMPTKVIIISDMQFNQCIGNPDDTAFEMIKRMYFEADYSLPGLIFWNVNDHLGNISVRCDQRGVALISGFSPAIVKSVLEGRIPSPKELMLRVALSDRYKQIKVL